MTEPINIVDADFKVVAGFQVGDRHPVKTRWRYTGLYDDQGNALWYRPPRFFPVWWGLPFEVGPLRWSTGGRFVGFCIMTATPITVIAVGALVSAAWWLERLLSSAAH